MRGQGGEVGVELIDYRDHAHDPEVKRRVMGITDLDVRGIAELNVRLGEAFAAACLATLQEAGLSPHDIDLIGSHGQTIYHHSGVAGALRATLQVGDGDVIAVRTGRYVISDFRARDIAAGGEGAPLSPIADIVLFGGRGRDEPRRRRAILNLGGIANLTVLDDDPARVFGFDTGPAHCALKPPGAAAFSDSAAWPAIETAGLPGRGRIGESLLAELLENDPFLLAPRPPEVDRGSKYVRRCVRRSGRRASRRLRR